MATLPAPAAATTALPALAHDDRGLVQGRIIVGRNRAHLGLGELEACARLGGVATGAENVKRLCHGPTLGRGARAYQMKGFTGNAAGRMSRIPAP